MTIIYGKCGNACEICMNYASKCMGCPAENEDNPGIYDCLFYNCAVDKGVDSCLSCVEYPCKLTVGLSRSYCPIHSKEQMQSSEGGH